MAKGWMEREMEENRDAVEERRHVSRRTEGGREGGRWDVEGSQGAAQPCILMSHHYMLL